MRQDRDPRSTRSGTAQRARARVAAVTIAMLVFAVLGVTLVPGVASAATPDCVRNGEGSGPCVQKTFFPADFPETKPHGVMLIVAGGGWQSGNPNTASAYYQKAFNRWLARGYIVTMVEHSDGSGAIPNTPTADRGFNNVLQWYDQSRVFWNAQAGYGASFPICATGFSSGGHFALMLGAVRPSLSCIVVEGAPTRIHYAAGATRASGISQEAQNIADLSFSGVQGVSPTPNWSPLSYRSQGQLRMPILFGHANNDPLVSSAQTHTFCPRTSTNCRAEYLDAGGGGLADFTHADVKNQDLLDFRAKERSWVCAVVSRFTGPCR